MAIDVPDYTNTVASLQKVLGSFGAIASGTSPSKTFFVDVGSHAIALQFQNIPNGPGQVIIGGVESNSIIDTVQFSQISALGGDWWITPLVSGEDRHVSVQIQNNSGVTIDGVVVTEIPDTLAVVMWPPPSLITSPTFNQTGWSVTEAQSDPAPWQAPNQSALINQNVALTTAVTVIPAVGGKSIYLHWVTISIDGSFGTSDWRVRDGTTDIGGAYGSTSRGVILSKDFKGRKLTQGNAFTLFLAAGTGGGFASCTADYAQQ